MRRTVKDDWTVQLAMMEEYDQTYGIFDHEALGEMDPLAIIGMHPAEDVHTGNRIELLMNELMATRIPEITNTPLLDLLRYPKYYLDWMIREGRKARRKEDEVVTDLTNAANANAPKGKETP